MLDRLGRPRPAPDTDMITRAVAAPALLLADLAAIDSDGNPDCAGEGGAPVRSE